jgi:hypothetical protein
MILLIVAVFDPLALVLILAAQQSIRWAQGEDQEEPVNEKEEESSYTSPVEDLEPVVDEVEIPAEYFDDPEPDEELPVKKSRWSGFGFPLSSIFGRSKDEDDSKEPTVDLIEKEAQRAWKEANPDETIKEWRRKHQVGQVDEVPWKHPDYHPAYQDRLGLEADNAPSGSKGEVRGFGTAFPTDAVKGDMFLRVDQQPTMLFKYNGQTWIEIDKELSDQHAYDEAYIDHLIEKISTGEYDPELLSSAERDSIEQRLKNNPRQV